MKETSYKNSFYYLLSSKIVDYFQLIKFTLSFTVVFSCVVSYLLVPTIHKFVLIDVLVLFFAGMLITGSANALNQTFEHETDALMKRTMSRPIPSGRMSTSEGFLFAFFSGLIGVLTMYFFFNPASALLSAFSLFVYSFVYTPLKKVNSVAVLVGALPGALPCLIGWVAGSNNFSIGGWLYFAIQFFWQFPHFWAIAWISNNDYNRVGFKLLPSKDGPNKFTAVQCIVYSLLMIPFGFLPYHFGLTGLTSLWIVLIANLIIVFQSIRLYYNMDIASARRVMFTSYIYLPVVFLSLLANKIY